MWSAAAESLCLSCVGLPETGVPGAALTVLGTSRHEHSEGIPTGLYFTDSRRICEIPSGLFLNDPRRIRFLRHMIGIQNVACELANEVPHLWPGDAVHLNRVDACGYQNAMQFVNESPKR